MAKSLNSRAVRKPARETSFTLARLINYISSLADHLVIEQRHGTARTYRSVRNLIGHYIDSTQSAQQNVDCACIDCLASVLRQRNLSINTISFYLRVLRTVLRRAFASGIIKTDPAAWFTGHFTGFASTKKRALPIEQLRLVAALDCYGKRSLMIARDIFIFSYQGRGIPFVDLFHLRQSNITENHLTYNRYKTRQPIEVELQPGMLDILRRYYVSPTPDNPNPHLFPLNRSGENDYRSYRSALTAYNRHLRIIAQMAGIKGKLSSYTARHTWATEACNTNVPIRLISQALGHQSVRTTATYLSLANNDLLDSVTRKVSNSIIV